MTKANCLFCRIAHGEEVTSKVCEDEHTLAFLDIAQQTRGHVLVIPRRHWVNIFDISREDASAVMETTRKVSRAMKVALHADGINLFQSNGSAAKQDIFHFHIHLFARYRNDGVRNIGFEATLKYPSRVELDTLAGLIAGALTK